MHEKRFDAAHLARLRSPERIARLEVTRVVEEALAGLAAQTLLDVGTGSGLFAEAFAKRGLRVVGIDASAEMIVAAQGYVPEGEFRVATAEALPFTQAAFDIVFMANVLHETDDRLKVLQEARRVGRRRVAVLEWPYREEPFGPPLGERLKAEEVEELARRAGFAKVEAVALTHEVLYRLEV